MLIKKITKKAYSLSLLALIITGQSNSKCMQMGLVDFKHAMYVSAVLGTAVAGTTCSTLYLWYKKRQLSKELEILRSGNIQKENDQKFLIEIGQYIDSVNQKFEQEILLAKSKNNLYQEEYIERWVNIAKQKRSMVQSINMAHSALSTYKKDLEIRISEWDRTNLSGAYINKGKELFKELISLEKLFNDMYQSITGQLNFIDLSLLMDRNSLSEYSRELDLKKQFSGQQYFIELDKIIRSNENVTNQFPYLSYSSKLKNHIENLKTVLTKLKNVKLYIFQERVIAQANILVVELNNLLENIVSVRFYQEEQIKKPEFEKQQKLLAAELKEREEKMLREKQLVETKLLNEKNKEQNLSNERAKIECERQALIVQERNIIYELERIRNGQALKEELAKENIKNEKKLKSEIEKAQGEAQKVVTAKENELINLRYAIQNLDYQKRQADMALSIANRNVTLCKQYIQNLQDKLNTPPCNPEAVDGLSDYLKSLKDLANNAVRSV